jgi:hypothetical protein
LNRFTAGDWESGHATQTFEKCTDGILGKELKMDSRLLLPGMISGERFLPQAAGMTHPVFIDERNFE